MRPQILLVHAEDMLMEGWERELERAEIACQAAHSFGEAVEVLARNQGDFDAMVLDIHTPGRNELFHLAETQYPGLEHRIVFLTSGAATMREREFMLTTQNLCVDRSRRIAALIPLVRDWAIRRQSRGSPDRK